MNPLLLSLQARGKVVVEWVGIPGAKMAIVGEALGEQEERLKGVFCGMAGYFLDDVLRCAGIPRQELFLTNVVPIRPRDNKIVNLSELGLTPESFYPSLKERLEKFRPNVVLALGDVALAALTGKHGITKWRGSILESTLVPGLKVVCSFHPSGVMRLGAKVTAKKEIMGKGGIKYDYGSARTSLVVDCKRAWDQRTFCELPKVDRQLVVGASYDVIRSSIRNLYKSDFLTFDIESVGSDIVRVGFANSPYYAISIPLGSSFWNPSEEAEIISDLGHLFSTHQGLIAQNANFDMTMMLQHFSVGMCHFDTMLAHALLYPELPHGLDYLASIYTLEPYYKWMAGADLSTYNCLDAAVTFEVALRLKEELKEFNLEDFFYGYTLPLFHMIFRMEHRGLLVDLKKLAVMREKFQKKLEEDESKFQELSGWNGNIGSPAQVAKLLYEKMGLPTQYSNEGKVTTDEKALMKLWKKYRKPELRSIIDIRGAKKMLSTYIGEAYDEEEENEAESS